MNTPREWGIFCAWLGIAASVARAVYGHGCSTRRGKVVVRLGGLSWTREDFCRGWLITGDTGSGKTRSGITPLLYQVFKNEPTWGGLCIDDKGLYWETLSAMAAHFGRSYDLILLQVKPDDAAPDWAPKHVFNLTGDRSIPSRTYAKFVVDTAASLGQQGEKSFFKNQAQTHIACALDALHEVRADVTLENAYNVLLNGTDLSNLLAELRELRPSVKRRTLLGSQFHHRANGGQRCQRQNLQPDRRKIHPGDCERECREDASPTALQGR